MSILPPVPEWIRNQARQWLEVGQDDETNVRGRRKTMRFLQAFFLALTAVLPLWAGVWFLLLDKAASGGSVALFLYFQLFFLSGFAVCRAQAQDLQNELRTIRFENQIQTSPADSATKFFLKNEIELKRYYDQALRQSSLVFFLGVLCVLAGLAAVTAAGASVALRPSQDTTQQIVVGTLGAVGGLLSGFVARVYLGLHRGTVLSLTQFHTRFVLTHHLLFSNVLVERITEGQQRDAALHAVVKAIAERPETEQPPDGAPGHTTA